MLAHPGARRDVDHLLRVVGGAAEARGQHDRAAVVDVGVVLPGEADAAVHLDAVLGAVLRGGGRQRRGDRGGELESACPPWRFSRCSSMARAASHTAAVARSVSAIISAHLCLMAWNWPIGRPNCSRILAYADAVSVAHRATPMHSADSSVDISARARVRLRLLSTRSSPTSTALARTWASGRSGSTLLTGSISSVVGVEHHPLLAAVDRHRQHQHRRLRGRGHRTHLAADDQAVAVPGGGQPGVDGVGGDHLAGGQVVEQLGVGVVAAISALAIADGTNGPGTAP